MQRVLGRIAENDCPVLILGEHGVGKRSMAAQIHAQSTRSRGEFREMDCKEASAAELEAALSTNGTIYLYDINDLSIPLQECIVHFCSRSEPAPTGRLLYGSSRELEEEVKLRRMKEDFYYLVSAVTLRIPPLRCRKAEILSIADELLTQYSKQFDRPKPVLCRESIAHLMEHNWAISQNFRPQSRPSSPSETRQSPWRPSKRRQRRDDRMGIPGIYCSRKPRGPHRSRSNGS